MPSQWRPLFQGDILDDVPFIKGRSGGGANRDPNAVVERRRVCITGYPCDLYNPLGQLFKVQAVAVVRDGSNDRIAEDWQGNLSVCPLPDLNRDGKTWVADFRAVANIDRVYLARTTRVAALTEVGWAHFRQRLALAYTRSLIPIETLKKHGQDIWREVGLWEVWNSRSSPSEFQDWYRAPCEALDGCAPRVAAERGDYDAVRLLIEKRGPQYTVC